MSPRDGNHGCH
jgi:hypothetical protein